MSSDSDAPAAGSLSDVSFVVEGRKLHLHKAVLAARSQYFAGMFRHGACVRAAS